MNTYIYIYIYIYIYEVNHYTHTNIHTTNHFGAVIYNSMYTHIHTSGHSEHTIFPQQIITCSSWNVHWERHCWPMLIQLIVTPLLKKPNADCEILKNYRPVSNLTFLSKILEKVVARRLFTYMSENGLHEKMQSAYRNAHSTESALLRL